MPDPISWALDWPRYAAALGGGYLLGTIPFGLILAWLAGLGDIRKIGSGNIGATNVLRTGRKGLAALTVLLDGFKGTAAVLIAYHGSGLGLGGPDLAVTAGFGAFVGHCFPVWLAFRGGKGVATYLGILLGLFWPAMLAAGAIWIAVAFAFRYSSLAAIVASAATPVVLFLTGQIQYAELFAVLTLMLWLRHAANVRRLVRGEEGRIGA